MGGGERGPRAGLGKRPNGGFFAPGNRAAAPPLAGARFTGLAGQQNRGLGAGAAPWAQAAARNYGLACAPPCSHCAVATLFLPLFVVARPIREADIAEVAFVRKPTDDITACIARR